MVRHGSWKGMDHGKAWIMDVNVMFKE